MSFDPQREDYQRLGLRYAASLQGMDPTTANRAFASFGRRFSQDRDSLPQTDGDRAFHLVAMASVVIDYQLPFADEQHAQQLVDRGHQLLEEAISLDANCSDAYRMQAAADAGSFEAYYEFLRDGAAEVKARCLAERDAVSDQTDGERAQLARDVAIRPYLRWMSMYAEEALICGRNKEAVRVSRELLEQDPHDQADVRFTAALAYAKLEDEAGLKSLEEQVSPLVGRATDDAWTQLARIALAYKSRDYARAEQVLHVLVHSYPYAAEALLRQNELPDGVFARLAAMPYSEDELILAVSEGTVLLQEGRDPKDRGALGGWLADQAARFNPGAYDNFIREQFQSNNNDDPAHRAGGPSQGTGRRS